jgi:hypothetical protein
MFFLDAQLSDLPVHVTIASEGTSVLAFGHMDDFASALVWCGRAMQLYGQADQVAIGRPALAEWSGVGKVSIVTPSHGWTRALDGWHLTTQGDLRRFFERVPERPRTFATEAPPPIPSVGSTFPDNEQSGTATRTVARTRSEAGAAPELLLMLRGIHGTLR